MEPVNACSGHTRYIQAMKNTDNILLRQISMLLVIDSLRWKWFLQSRHSNIKGILMVQLDYWKFRICTCGFKQRKGID